MLLIHYAEKEAIAENITRRLLAIQQAVQSGQIRLDALEKLCKVSSIDLMDPNHALFAVENTLFSIINGSEQLNLIPSPQLTNHLCNFDEIQGEYLHLPSLAAAGADTIRANLNDLAGLYLHFGQYMSATKAGDSEEYQLAFDERAAQRDWQSWLGERPARSNVLNGGLQPSCLLDKFLAGCLGSEEWLSDRDIATALKQFGVTHPPVAIVRFKADEIGLNLHFEREAHCDGLEDYTIPLMINLGESNHSRMDDPGQHWVYMLVKVNPRDKQIAVDYVDSIQLSPNQKKEIAATLKEAFAYTETIGNVLSGNAKYYQAYGLEYSIEFNIGSSNTQKDAYTCGYRAVQGLVLALVQAGLVNHSEDIARLQAAQSPEELKKLFYTQLICRQEITDNQKAHMGDIANELFDANDPRFIHSAIVLAKLEYTHLAPRKKSKKDKANQLMSTAEVIKLKAVAAEQEALKELLNFPHIAALVKPEYEKIEVNIDELLQASKPYAPAVVIKAIFTTLKQNSHVKQIMLHGCADHKKLILENVEQFVGVQINSLDMAKELQCIHWRNQQIEGERLEPARDPWAVAFDRLFYSLDNALPKEFNSDFGMEKLSQYLAEHKDKWIGNPKFPVLNLLAIDSEQALAFLAANRNHIPCREVALRLKGSDLIVDAFLQSCYSSASEHIEQFNIVIEKPHDQIFEISCLLKAHVNGHNHFAKRLNFDLKTQTFIDIQNIIESRRRQDGIVLPSRSASPAEGENSIYLALFQSKDEDLDIDIDQEQEQQQQQEQQMQCEVADAEIEEERGANEENFDFFASDEMLIDRSNIAAEMGAFIEQQGIKPQDIELTAESYWDLIVGKYADQFKYGIKKLTRSAAEKLILNIKECRYGLSLDNLPRGFKAHENLEGELFLSYDATDMTPAPHETPLTLSFDERPMAAETWLGDMSQFLDSEQQRVLYNVLNPTPRSILHKKNKAEANTPDELRLNFFGLFKPEAEVSVEKKLQIIAAISGSQFCKNVQELFKDSLTHDNVMAIAHMLYKGNRAFSIELFEQLAQLKAKNPGYFAHFKKHFMDPSQNWSELAARESIDAIAKINQFTPAQLLWWQELTAQHRVGLEAIRPNETPWISLVACMQSFSSFQEKLDEIAPGLKLLEYFPFENISHMKLGLERLLSILDYSKDKMEQWAILQGCELTALGPFYASRYEGFSVVSAAMELQHRGEGRSELQTDCAYRLKKESIKDRLSSEFDSIFDLGEFGFRLLNADEFSQAKIIRGLVLWTQEATQEGTQLYYKYLNEKGEIISGYLFTKAEKLYSLEELNKNKVGLINALIARTPILPPNFCSFLRYPATFNARFDYATYQNLLNIVISLKKSCEEKDICGYQDILSSLMSVILEICVGKSCGKVNLQQLESVLVAPLSTAINEPDIHDKLTKISKFDLLYQSLSLWVKHGSLDLDKIKVILERLFFEEERALVEKAFLMIGSSFHNLVNFVALETAEEHQQKNLEALIKYAKNRKSNCFCHLGDILHSLRPLYEMEMHIKESDEDGKLLMTLLIKAIGCLDMSFLEGDLNALKRLTQEEYKKILYKLSDLLLTYPQYKQTLLAVMDKWSSIDVEASAQLPPVENLMQLLAEMQILFADDSSLDIRGIDALVRKHSHADIQFDKAVMESSSYQMQGSLSSVLSTKMIEIIDGLKAHIANMNFAKQIVAQTAVNQIFGEDYKILRLADGANTLIKMLADLKIDPARKEMPFYGEVRETVQSVMTKVYDNLISSAAVLISPGASQLFTTRLSNPLQGLSFNDFADQYGKSLSCVNRSLEKITELKKKWPKQFNELEHVLITHPGVSRLNIYEFENLISMLVDNLSDKQSPVSILTFLLENLRNSVDKSILSNSRAILEAISAAILKDENTYSFTAEELLHLLRLPHLSPELLQSLCALKKDMPKSFGKILTFNLVDPDALNEFVAKLKALAGKLKAGLVETLIDLADNAEFVNGFLALSDPIDQELMILLLPQAKHNSNEKEQLLAILQLLEKSPQLVPVVKTVYALQPYPSLVELLGALNADDKQRALMTLLSRYDSDPYDYRKKISGLKEAQFDTGKFEFLINGAQDLLADRELVLADRQQLYDWLMYVNYVGQNEVIAVNGRPKAIIDMTRDEILSLIDASKARLKEKNVGPQERIKLRLEFIALMREVMYRATTTADNPGRFAYPNQLLFLLSAMQKGDKFIAEIATGQGKSLTAALAVGLCCLEGYPVDVCSSTLHLARAGLEENKGFFDYLAIPCTLIQASSKFHEYVTGGVHYTSLPDRALFQLAQERKGHKFPEKIVGIIDEVDFYSLDDNLNYRLALSLDPVSDPHESPYRWIYEKAIEFVDSETERTNDKGYVEKFKKYLLNTQVNKEKKSQLQALLALPTADERLKTWLLAAAKTATLQDKEEEKFRILLVKKRIGGETVEVSKACILVNGQPKPEAEFSDAIQQFLHLRLLKRYEAQIQAATMPSFLVEPEKACVAKLTSRLMLESYLRLWGVTGTAGSEQERMEQNEKYGVAMTRLPSYHPSRRQYLDPILTNYYSSDKESEEKQHIDLIVAEIIRYRAESQGPVLIHCKDKLTGEKIAQALALKGQQALEYYGSDDPEQDARHKNLAGQDGAITISTVFSRGTDIKPRNKEGLYSISTCVNNPNSIEDLTRSLQQAFGRAARQDQEGSVRLILRRSEFEPVFADNPNGLKRLKLADVYLAIERLNAFYSQPKAVARNAREQFDQVVHLFFAAFLGIYRDLGDKATGEDPYMVAWTQFLKELSIEKPVNVYSWVETRGFEMWNQFLQGLSKIDASVPSETFNNLLTPKGILISINSQPTQSQKFYVSKKQYNPDELLPIWKKEPSLICSMVDPKCSQEKKKKAVDLSLETIFDELQKKYPKVLIDFAKDEPKKRRAIKASEIDAIMNGKLKVWLNFILSRKMAAYLKRENASDYNSTLKKITDLLVFCNNGNFNAIWEGVNLEHYADWIKHYNSLKTAENKNTADGRNQAEDRKKAKDRNNAICYMRTFLRETPEDTVQWKAKCLDLEIANFCQELEDLMRKEKHRQIKVIMQELQKGLTETMEIKKNSDVIENNGNKLKLIYFYINKARKELAQTLLPQALLPQALLAPAGSEMRDFDLSSLNKLLNERKRRLMFTCVGGLNATVESINLSDFMEMFDFYKERGVFAKLGKKQCKELYLALDTAKEVMGNNTENPLELYKALLVLCARIQAALGDASKHRDGYLKSLYFYTLNLRADLLFKCDMDTNGLKQLNESVTAKLYTTAPTQLGATFFAEREKHSSIRANVTQGVSLGVSRVAERMTSSSSRDKTDDEKNESPFFFKKKEKSPSALAHFGSAASIAFKRLPSVGKVEEKRNESHENVYGLEYNCAHVDLSYPQEYQDHYSEAAFIALLSNLEQNIVECKPNDDLKVSFKKIMVTFIEGECEFITISVAINGNPLTLHLTINNEKKTILMDANLLDDDKMKLDFSACIPIEPEKEKEKEKSVPLAALMPSVVDSTAVLLPPLAQPAKATVPAPLVDPTTPLFPPLARRSSSIALQKGRFFAGHEEEESVSTTMKEDKKIQLSSGLNLKPT